MVGDLLEEFGGGTGGGAGRGAVAGDPGPDGGGDLINGAVDVRRLRGQKVPVGKRLQQVVELDCRGVPVVVDGSDRGADGTIEISFELVAAGDGPGVDVSGACREQRGLRSGLQLRLRRGVG